MTVPDEAVEAATRVLWYSEKYAKWESVPQYRKDPYLNEARKALTAAAPFIAAQAWDEGADSEFQRSVMKRQATPNPYRSQA